MNGGLSSELRPLLRGYLGEFEDCFARGEPAGHLLTYVSGQLSDLRRKSIGPIADAAGIPPRTLQHFLSRHAWDEELVLDTLQQIVGRNHQHPRSIGIIDETAHPKKGDRTPGVERQWCRTTGRMDNCVLTVHLGYVAGGFHCLLDGELFLPKSWADARQRCRRAGIPEEMTHRPQWQIALDMYRRAVANGVRFEWLAFDEHYGQFAELLFRLDDRGQRYVAEVPPTFSGWLIKPALLQKGRHQGKGRPRRPARLKSRDAPAGSIEDLCRLPYPVQSRPWRRLHIKEGAEEPIILEAKAVRFHLERDDLPTWPHLLILARSAADPTRVKYFVSRHAVHTRTL